MKSARREAGLTQGELAAEVGCKQSALSMFEQGDGTKLNDEVIDKLAKKFNLSLTPLNSDDSTDVPSQSIRGSQFASYSTPALAFCPNPHCPSNHEYHVEDARLFLPDNSAADPAHGKYCAMCGELLERKCPNCGARIHAGAICTHCGNPYIASI